MAQLRWGVLGTSRINQAVVPAIQASACNQPLAIASRSLERARGEADRFSVPRAYGSYEELLADPELDVIYVALPNVLHAEWTMAALRSGKHVLCEKPLAPSLAEIDGISDAARIAGAIVAEAFMYRHHPQTLRVRELVAAGVLGRIRLVRASFSFTMTRPNDVRLEPLPGAGCLWDLGCYPVSYARFVLGEEPNEAFGWQAVGATGVDETFAGQLRFASGALAQFDCSFRAPLRSEVEIVGDEATLRVGEPWKPGLRTMIELRREGQAAESIEIAGASLYGGEVEDMADAITEGRPQRVSLRDSRANCAALLALGESARTGRPVSIE